MGATKIIGEEALFVFHEGEGESFRLTGLVGVHADDFNTMSTDNFHKKVTDKLQACRNSEKNQVWLKGYRSFIVTSNGHTIFV